MREPILMKFGMQQQVKTAVTVTGSNIKFFLNSKWWTAAMLKNILNAINLLSMDLL